jgi:hypothetical protein
MKKTLMTITTCAIVLLAACGNKENPVSNADVLSSMPQTSNLSTPASASEPIPASQIPSSSTASSAFAAGNNENRELADAVYDHYLTEIANLAGITLEVLPEGFTFEAGTPQLSPNGAYETLITRAGDVTEVHYADEVVFLFVEYERSTDASIQYIGTVDDISRGRNVAVWGEYEGDIFVANVVQAVVFV